MESTPGKKKSVKTIEMTMKDVEYCINLVNEEKQDLRRLIPILKEVPLRGKSHHTASHAAVVSFMKGRVNQCLRLHCFPVLRVCCNHLDLQQPRPEQSVSFSIKARPPTCKKTTIP